MCVACVDWRRLILSTLGSLDVLSASVEHLPDLKKAEAGQVAAITRTEISFKGGLLNFVENVSHQKMRWKKMQRTMSRAKHARNESFLFLSPVPVLWKASDLSTGARGTVSGRGIDG